MHNIQKKTIDLVTEKDTTPKVEEIQMESLETQRQSPKDQTSKWVTAKFLQKAQLSPTHTHTHTHTH